MISKAVIFSSALLCCFVLATFTGFAQIREVKLEQIEGLQKVKSKPILVFIYTDWCNYCHAMKNTAFKNPEIIKILNESFYTVMFNAEQKEDVEFAGKTYKYKPSGFNTGVHELDAALRNSGQVSYPLICLLNEKNQVIYQNNSFINKGDLKKLLKAALSAFQNQ